VTSVYDKSDLQPKGLIEKFEFDGIEVQAVNVRLSNKHGIFRRILTFSQFLLLAAWLAVRTPADILIASSGPLTIGIPALLASLFRRNKFVFEMRDVFSEGVRQVGVVKSRLAFRLLRWFELLLCRHSDQVVALSPGIAEWVKSHCPSTAVVVIPNAADNELFGGQKSRLVQNEGKPIRAVFTGTIGTANNCGLLVEAADELQRRGQNNIRIELIGDGKERPRLEKEVQKRGLTNIHFRHLMPKIELVKELAGADIALLVLKPMPVFDSASPNKLFDAFAAGLPVIQTTQGWIKELLDYENCGLTVPGDDPKALVEALLTISENFQLRQEMSANASKLAMERFDRDILADKMLSALISM
jgi:glycosyltransferase involved in cell wall biosynthesis